MNTIFQPLRGFALSRQALFWAFSCFVVAVSIYDGWLLIKNESVILDFEKNPVCKFLIECDGGRVDLLIQWKAVGTTLVFLLLKTINLVWSRWALLVASSLAFFQAILLGILTLA